MSEFIPELPAARRGGSAPVLEHASYEKEASSTGAADVPMVKPHWYRSTLFQCVTPLFPTPSRPSPEARAHTQDLGRRRRVLLRAGDV